MEDDRPTTGFDAGAQRVPQGHALHLAGQTNHIRTQQHTERDVEVYNIALFFLLIVTHTVHIDTDLHTHILFRLTSTLIKTMQPIHCLFLSSTIITVFLHD